MFNFFKKAWNFIKENILHILFLAFSTTLAFVFAPTTEAAITVSLIVAAIYLYFIYAINRTNGWADIAMDAIILFAFM